MALPMKPRQHTALKKDRWWLVPAIENPLVPEVGEVNAAGGIYATCFLLEDQGGVTKTVNKVQLTRLLCDDSQPERLAPPTFSMSDIVGVLDPQAPADHDDKALFEFLRDGFVGFAVREQNKINDVSDVIAAGEFVDVIPVEIDSSWPDKSGTGPEGFYTFTCGVALTGTPIPNVAVVTGS